LYFWTPEQFWTWLASHHVDRRTLWMFSYRLGETLTLVDFWKLLENGFYQLEDRDKQGREAIRPDDALEGKPDYLLCTRDPPTIVMARHNAHFLRCCDLRNYFPDTLEELAALVELPRIDRPDWKAGDKAWMQYAMQDVHTVERVLCRLFKWWEDGKYGVFKYTASSLAFSAYRHRHMKEKILIDDCEPARALSREALAGGECRLFYCGPVVDPLQFADQVARKKKGAAVRLRSGPVYVYDLNGAYAGVMRENWYPRKLVAYKPAAEMDDLYEWRKTLCMVARVRLVTPERPFPVWTANRRWYCVGDFWTSLAGPELEDALDRGFVRQVSAIAAYLPARLFTSFVDDIYPQVLAAQNEGRKPEARFLKMLYKSLAGKFGQREGGWNWSDIPGWGQKWGTFPRAIDGNADSRLYRLIAGYVQQLDDQIDAIDSLPAIEAYVNAYGRLYMAWARDRLPSGSVLYQDTDSLHVTEEGKEAMEWKDMIHPTRLGYFHLERIAQIATYRGPKDYTLDGEHIVAGMKQGRVNTGKTFYVQEETDSLDAVLMREPDGTVKVQEVRKRFGAYHPAGMLSADGTVKPALLLGDQLHLRPVHFAPPGPAS
jgi:hypothetical protein